MSRFVPIPVKFLFKEINQCRDCANFEWIAAAPFKQTKDLDGNCTFLSKWVKSSTIPAFCPLPTSVPASAKVEPFISEDLLDQRQVTNIDDGA